MIPLRTNWKTSKNRSLWMALSSKQWSMDRCRRKHRLRTADKACSKIVWVKTSLIWNFRSSVQSIHKEVILFCITHCDLLWQVLHHWDAQTSLLIALTLIFSIAWPATVLQMKLTLKVEAALVLPESKSDWIFMSGKMVVFTSRVILSVIFCVK